MPKTDKKFSKQAYTMSCKDLGSPDCSFSITTHSSEEIKKAMFAHAGYAHPEIMKKMSETEKQTMVHKMDEMLIKK